MNLYLRYFDLETLVTNVNDAIDFLISIPEIQMNDKIAEEVRDFFESDVRYPKRYKVRPRIYFIMIKTDANSMQEFKERKNNPSEETQEEGQQPLTLKQQRDRDNQMIIERLTTIHEGWYQGEINFKRVITIPSTGKHEYRDCTFVACCKAESPQDCYNRLIEYLSQRVDRRSQFPSIKGHNFKYSFLGKSKPLTATL